MSAIITLAGSWDSPWLRETLKDGTMLEIWPARAEEHREEPLWIFHDEKPYKSPERLPAWMVLA